MAHTHELLVLCWARDSNYFIWSLLWSNSERWVIFSTGGPGGPRNGRAWLETQLWPPNWSPGPSPELKAVQFCDCPISTFLAVTFTSDAASVFSRKRNTLEEISLDRPCQSGSAFCPVRLILLLCEKAPPPCHFGALSSLPLQEAYPLRPSGAACLDSVLSVSFLFIPRTESDPALLLHPFLPALLFFPKVINQSGPSCLSQTSGAGAEWPANKCLLNEWVIETWNMRSYGILMALLLRPSWKGATRWSGIEGRGQLCDTDFCLSWSLLVHCRPLPCLPERSPHTVPTH